MKFSLSILAILLVSWSFAQGSKEFTLQQAQTYAVENSYTTRASSLDVEAARKKVSETTGIGLPQISGSAEFNNFLDIPTQVAPATAFGDPTADPNELIPLQFGTDYSAKYGITATQLIYDGSYFVGLKASKAFLEMANIQAEKSDEDVKAMVTVAYGQVLVAEENARILKSNTETLSKILEETKALQENGFAEESDVDQARLLLAGVQNAQRNADRQVQNAYNLLKFQMGIKLDDEIALKDDLDALMAFENSAELLDSKLNLGNSIDYRIAKSNLMLMDLDYKNKKAAFHPRLSAFYSFEQNTFANTIGDVGETFFPTNLWGVRLDVPILNGGSKFARNTQARIARDQAEITLMQAEEGTKLEVKNARSNYQFALDQHETEKENMDLAKRIRDKNQIKYQEGVASSLELTQSENQYLSTQGNYVKSLLDLVQAKSDLDKALGNY